MAFNGVGFEGTVGEAEFADMLGAVGEHGIMGTFNGSAFSATRVAGARQMLIVAGKCYAPGVRGELTVDTATTASSANSSGNPRIDLVVARFNWSANTVTLVTLEGTPAANPSPPAMTQTPGTTFDVPIRQSVLASGAGEYTVADVAAGDRRHWVVAGKIVVPSTRALTLLPAARAGLTVQRGGELLLGNGSGWDTYKEHADTGVVETTAISGFTGLTRHRILNGYASVWLNWTKSGSNLVGTDVTGWTVPPVPSNTVYGDVWRSGPTPYRLAFTPNVTNSIGTISNLTINPGETITGFITFPVA